MQTKKISQFEDQRKEFALKTNFQNIEIYDEVPSSIRFDKPLGPFHFPLKKLGQKFPSSHIQWYDLASLNSAPNLKVLMKSLAEFVEKCHFPVILMTFADLIEGNNCIVEIIRNFKNLTIIFVPGPKAKEIAKKMIKMFDTKQHNGSKYEFLFPIISTIQSEFSSPIITFNSQI